MFERLTDRARKVMALANQEAQRFNHEYIGTEHILLGLVKEGSGVGANVLKALEIDLRKVRLEVEKLVKSGPEMVTMGKLPQTPRAKKVLEYAIEEARHLNHNYVGTEHLLLGLLREQDGVAAQVLMNLGVKLEEGREEVLNLLGAGIEPEEMEEVGEGGEEAPSASPRRGKSKTPALDSFGRDLTELAKSGELDPVIGRTKEIERLVQILCRRTKNNPVLLGEAGVGKTAIIEGLSQRIIDHEVPDLLHDRRVVVLDLAMMVAGTKYRGQFEARLKAIMKEITQSQDVIIFIDELHTLVGAGAAEGSIDASNMLKPALSRGEVQCIGATTLDEYRKYIEKNGALERRFQSIMVEPPSNDDAVSILRGLKDKYEKHHKARIVDDAIISAVKLSSQYVSDRYLPDKAIDVIDEACSKVRLEKETFPSSIRELQRQIEDTVRLKKDMIENQDFEKAVELRDQEEQDRGRLDELKSEWEADQTDEEALVTEDDVAYVVSRMTGIPLQRIEEVENEKLLRMEEELNSKIIGQEEATRLLTKAVRRSRAGLKNPKRPIGSFLFLGPTGVGKTEMARVLAEYMFGDASALIRIDMSEYMERFNVSRLTGAPPGYVGYEEGGQLTERVRRKPYSVILLDEIEKAHADIYHILLQVMDDGALTDSYGRLIDFKNTIIIMTSNLATRSIEKGTSLGFQKEEAGQGYDRVKDNIRDELKKTFNPEFLNRIDDVVIFGTLAHENILQIVDIEIAKVNETLADKSLSLELTQEAKDWLGKEGYDKAYGARPLRRCIQRHIEDTLSEEVLHGKFQDGGVILVKLAGDELVFEAKEDTEVFSIQDA